MGQKIDIRIMNLNKWYIPKSFSMDAMVELKESVVLGYFDAFQVRELQIDAEESHPFIAGYEKFAECKNDKKKNLVDYSSQEQMLFLNIGNEKTKDGICFEQETVNNFWKDGTCPYIFLSLIHINHSGKLEKALKKIHDVFQKDYLSYISFDYCDIVLFAHHLQICDFLNNIKRLFVLKEGEEGVIFDTFSMVSFQPPISRDKNCAEYLDKNGNQPEFQATINLSIRNYEKFEKWYEELEELLKKNMKKYHMFGRHDVSLVKDDANNGWLMRMMEKLHEKDEGEKIFWTFETYIKIPCKKDEMAMISNESEFLKTAYKNVKKNLDDGIEKLENVFSLSGSGRYLLPAYEVRDCICSIAKNSFAEEFIYCIYESFLHFVSYMKNEVEHLQRKGMEWPLIEMKIADVYDKYFTALNTLVNSTMHSERQFVQATAFNAVFYSVPPKIMAFYNAYSYRIKQILCDDGCKEQYTFLIYPSFCPKISVEQILLHGDSCPDRVLTVKISEESLYDIESVIYQLVHEQAHYVGDQIRCRAVRKEKIMETLLKHIAFKGRLGDEVNQILLPIVYTVIEPEIAADKEFESKDHDSFIYVAAMGKSLWQIRKHSSECKEAFSKYYQDKTDEDVDFFDKDLSYLGIEREKQKAYIVNLPTQYIDIKYKLFMERMERYDIEEEVEEYESLMNLLKSIYRESYADLQMILVLAMGAEDYLNTFFMKQKMTIEDMQKRMALDPEYMLRISTIYRLMTDSGIWKADSYSNKEMEIIIGLINQYNSEVREATDKDRHTELQQNINRISQAFDDYDFSGGIKLRKTVTKNLEKTGNEKETENTDIIPVFDAAIGLYEYLLEVLENSLKEYAEDNKKKKIQEVRKIVKTVLTFENVIQVFDGMEKELDYYKKEGCRIWGGTYGETAGLDQRDRTCL